MVHGFSSATRYRFKLYFMCKYCPCSPSRLPKLCLSVKARRNAIDQLQQLSNGQMILLQSFNVIDHRQLQYSIVLRTANIDGLPASLGGVYVAVLLDCYCFVSFSPGMSPLTHQAAQLHRRTQQRSMSSSSSQTGEVALCDFDPSTVLWLRRLTRRRYGGDF